MSIPIDKLKGLALDKTMPTSFRVVDLTPDNHATQLFGVIADYGWAERILFSDAYENDAVAICAVLDVIKRSLESEGELWKNVGL
jgi:hypothetical protein